jgi:hypothetical protein
MLVSEVDMDETEPVTRTYLTYKNAPSFPFTARSEPVRGRPSPRMLLINVDCIMVAEKMAINELHVRYKI